MLDSGHYSGKIIDEHNKKYYIGNLVTGGTKNEFRYELINSYDFNYRSGSEARNPQGKRPSNLLLAGYIRQLGYYEDREHDSGISSLSHHIRSNKDDSSYGFFLANAMYEYAKKYWNVLLNADIIVPVPNYKSDEQIGAVSIAKYLSDCLKKPCKNMLVKNVDVHTRGMSNDEKEEIYKKLDVYGFNPEFDSIIKGKNIALIDDIVTSGYTAHECLRLLRNPDETYGRHKVNNIYFYCAGTTYWRFHG